VAAGRCVLHSSDEPGELSQRQCHGDSTINTGIGIINISDVDYIVGNVGNGSCGILEKASRNLARQQRGNSLFLLYE